jgi:hypothetical protein
VTIKTSLNLNEGCVSKNNIIDSDAVPLLTNNDSETSFSGKRCLHGLTSDFCTLCRNLSLPLPADSGPTITYAKSRRNY